MSKLIGKEEGARVLLMGNEAIARGALEAGVRVAAGYPGTPSSEIIENLAKVARERNLYVEWSVNEKVSLEIAAAASFANLRALCPMKQNGVNVASDFLLHLAGSGTRGGLVLVSCDDPGALSSVNEGESRHFARLMELPLIEPGDFQEAKDMTRWAFELSETLKCVVMLRSVTRMSHASGDVVYGALPEGEAKAFFQCDGFILDPVTGPVMSAPVPYRHGLQQDKIREAREIFEDSPFNTYEGPERPELLIITSSACTLYSREAIRLLGLGDRVGLLKLGTTWPLPPKLLKKYLSATERVLIDGGGHFLPRRACEGPRGRGCPRNWTQVFLRQERGDDPLDGRTEPGYRDQCPGHDHRDRAMSHASEYEKSAQLPLLPGRRPREPTFCPGCPHRASFWSIHRALQATERQGFNLPATSDAIRWPFCLRPQYAEDLPLHGLGPGFGGRLRQARPVRVESARAGRYAGLHVFHAVLQPLINAVHHRSNVTLVVLDNSGTAMTGFQASTPALQWMPWEGTLQRWISPGSARRSAPGFRPPTRSILRRPRRPLRGFIEQEGVKVTSFGRYAPSARKRREKRDLKCG